MAAPWRTYAPRKLTAKESLPCISVLLFSHSMLIASLMHFSVLLCKLGGRNWAAPVDAQLMHFSTGSGCSHIAKLACVCEKDKLLWHHRCVKRAEDSVGIIVVRVSTDVVIIVLDRCRKSDVKIHLMRAQSVSSFALLFMNSQQVVNRQVIHFQNSKSYKDTYTYNAIKDVSSQCDTTSHRAFFFSNALFLTGC